MENKEKVNQENEVVVIETGLIEESDIEVAACVVQCGCNAKW